VKLSYIPATDSLYIEVVERPGTDAEEIRPGIVLDLDDSGRRWASTSSGPARGST